VSPAKRKPPPAGTAPDIAPADGTLPEPGDARLARRERRRSRTRDEILEAARQVLLRNGIAGTTLEAVAREVGVTKTALYYYFPSKEALLFELVYGVLRSQAVAVSDEVERSADGADALRAILTASVKTFAQNLDDFRLAYLYGQVAGHGAIRVEPQQFARIRPLNDLWFAGAAAKLAADRRRRRRPQPERAPVEPRLMAFLAYLSAIGLLTVKGMVENVGDPLLYSDDQLVDGFARVFAAAASA
jgi:AcrR family transcriptional regulator